MNNTTTRIPAIIVLIFTAAALVVGAGTFAATQSAFASKKDNGNGNTVTHQKNKQDGTASGFDNSFEEEGQNLICTHPNDTATCTQEGVSSTTTPTPTSTPQPTTGTLLVTVGCSSNRDIPPLCPDKGGPEFIIIVTGNNPTPSTFPGSKTGTLVTLDPGEFTVTETNSGPWIVFISGDCKRVADTASATGTIAAGEHKTCQVGNALPG
jgi:hypothetical protein